jgi:RNA recognition motif-containing protein
MEQATQIYVSGIPFDVKEKDLRNKFEKFGSLKGVTIKNGFCFIVSL